MNVKAVLEFLRWLKAELGKELPRARPWTIAVPELTGFFKAVSSDFLDSVVQRATSADWESQTHRHKYGWFGLTSHIPGLVSDCMTAKIESQLRRRS
jgi:hypothetical protein